MTNYEGHDFTVTLYNNAGERVAGGYSSTASTSLYNEGDYYWEIKNNTKSNTNSYGGIKYELRYKG